MAISALPVCGFSHVWIISGTFSNFDGLSLLHSILELYLLGQKTKKSFEYKLTQNASPQVNALQKYKTIMWHIFKAL